jgi:hypothetical protein
MKRKPPSEPICSGTNTPPSQGVSQVASRIRRMAKPSAPAIAPTHTRRCPSSGRTSVRTFGWRGGPSLIVSRRSGRAAHAVPRRGHGRTAQIHELHRIPACPVRAIGSVLLRRVCRNRPLGDAAGRVPACVCRSHWPHVSSENYRSEMAVLPGHCVPVGTTRHSQVRPRCQPATLSHLRPLLCPA